VPVLQKKNGGQAAAMNAGFAASHGDLVIFLDADDYLCPKAAGLAAAALGPSIGTVQYRMYLVNAVGNCGSVACIEEPLGVSRMCTAAMAKRFRAIDPRSILHGLDKHGSSG
jgi:glycosyltransferase involved in cell wall biosynthesis